MVAVVRVCVVVPQFPVRSETFIVNQVEGLLARGHDVTIVPLIPSPDPAHVTAAHRDVLARTTARPGTPSSRWGWYGLRASAVLRHRGRPLRYALDTTVDPPSNGGRRLLLAERVAMNGRFDIVHAQFGNTLSAAVGLRRHGLVEAPIVLSIHGQDANVNAQDDPAAFAALAEQCAAVTVGTEFMRDVVADLGVARERTRKWFQGVATDRPVARRDRGSGLHVLSASRLVAFKGVDDSLRVIAAARPAIPGLRYTVLGDGAERAPLEALARELGVADITTFAGPYDEAQLLAAHTEADVFLQMGKIGPDGSKEGQGVGILEASISGLPVVTTNAGGLVEVAVQGETGFVVDSGDINGGALVLRQLANDQPTARQLGDQGRVFAQANFSLAASITLLESIYAEAAERAPVRHRTSGARRT